MKWIVRILILVVASVAVTGCYQQIPPSSVGVKFNAMSGISEKLLKPQVVPVLWNERLIIYPTSIRNASYVRRADEGETRGDDAIRASTIEGAILPMDLTVAWHVDPENVVKAFESFGTEDLSSIQRIFVRNAANYAVNVVSGRRSIFDLTSKERAKLGPEIREILAKILQPYGLTVDDVYVGEVFPDTKITGKVGERVSKRSELEQAIIGLEQAKVDARTTLTNAKKQAELNKLLAMQGGKMLDLKKLENRRKAIDAWNGEPSTVGDGTIPFTTIDPRTGNTPSPSGK